MVDYVERLLLMSAIFLITSAAHAIEIGETRCGPVAVEDADDVIIDGIAFRFVGIDAYERKEHCYKPRAWIPTRIASKTTKKDCTPH
jgi:hypothetical protein